MYHKSIPSTKTEREIRNFIKEQAANVYEYAKSVYGTKYLDDKLQVNINNHYHNYMSIGGVTKRLKPFITVNYLWRLRYSDQIEWMSYRKDKDIGSFRTKSFKKRMMALICHEIAHAIQHQLVWKNVGGYVTIPKGQYYGNDDFSVEINTIYENTSFGRTKSGFAKLGHGPLWQSIYRVLRKEFVNGKIYNDRGLGLSSKCPKKKKVQS